MDRKRRCEMCNNMDIEPNQSPSFFMVYRCLHPKANGGFTEHERLFGNCGPAGKLWEPKL